MWPVLNVWGRVNHLVDFRKIILVVLRPPPPTKQKSISKNYMIDN